MKRRVVKRAFYSSEEDESTEEEVEEHHQSNDTPEVRKNGPTSVFPDPARLASADLVLWNTVHLGQMMI